MLTYIVTPCLIPWFIVYDIDNFSVISFILYDVCTQNKCLKRDVSNREYYIKDSMFQYTDKYSVYLTCFTSKYTNSLTIDEISEM